MSSTAHPAALHHQFDTLEQQKESATLGMWLFLVQEILFFGGLFMAYMLYRWRDPQAFAAGSHELDITLGAINTVILIGSSLTMAMGCTRRRPTAPRRWSATWSRPASSASRSWSSSTSSTRRSGTTT